MNWPASIGIVMHDFPLGGTERIALRLARAWIGLGVAVTIFVGEDSGPLRALVPQGARLIPADPPIPRGRGSRRRLGTAAARHFARDRVGALFVTGNFHWETVPALAAIPDGPVVVAQISSPLAMPQRGWLRQRLFEARMRRLLRNADALVAMDEGYREAADRMMGRAMATAIPLPALDAGTDAPRPAHGRTILAAGRLIHQKGFDLLIRAFERLDDPEARLVIVGSGPEAARLEMQARATHCAGQIALPGFAPDIRPWLDAARLFVLPSRFEGYGAVIVEALGAGRQVVATRSTPAAADLLASFPERGAVVPVEDAEALARALRALLDRPAPDPAMLAAAVEPFRIDHGARAYLDLFAASATHRAMDGGGSWTMRINHQD